jgi:hypothetical protein
MPEYPSASERSFRVDSASEKKVPGLALRTVGADGSALIPYQLITRLAPIEGADQ